MTEQTTVIDAIDKTTNAPAGEAGGQMTDTHHWRPTGWMAVVGDGMAGEPYSWQACCQTQGSNFAVDEFHATREQCEEWIRREVFAANKMFDPNELRPGMVRL